uniref:ANK_REP_REGION domain-containing protein n=1 Tax=Setaria digitata TaxID=48799 RepID=A0A915PP25_9BILA
MCSGDVPVESSFIKQRNALQHFSVMLTPFYAVLYTLRNHRNLNINSNLMRTSALSLAVRSQNKTIVRILLDHNCELNKLSSDESGRLETPLYTAVRLHNYVIVELLLMYGADPNVTVSDNRTPLYLATKERCFNICNLLIAFGANLDIPDCTGQTPLHFACRNITGREQIAMLLIAHGANVHAADFKRRIPLDFAEINASIPIIKRLIDDGSPISKHMKERIRNMLQARSDQRGRMDKEQSCALAVVIDKTHLVVPTLLMLSKARIRNLMRQQARRIQNACSIWPLIDSLSMISNSLRDSLKLFDSFSP